ncbi:hypothetical protein C9374_004942 [Naegleria lovaniensis]|uniref:Uncharacterized protein n=1 Tax=Naegleria lovaniensis TaxID=51637 RepID=A0AA88GMD2_NAELO|nr:uncharacterized protein C9374_004942 [Naegleria lovaniensis]KAG2382975.1 hypothetical protein C9374_004942 [Naegleria lovaniensis]
MSSIHATTSTISPHFLTPSSAFSPFFLPPTTPSCRLLQDEALNTSHTLNNGGGGGGSGAPGGGGGVSSSLLLSSSIKNFNDVFDHLLAHSDVLQQQQQQQQQQRYERSPLLDMAHLFSPSNDFLNALDFGSFVSSTSHSNDDSSPSSSSSSSSSSQCKSKNVPSLTLQVPDLSNLRPKAKKVVEVKNAKEETKKKRGAKRKKEEEEQQSVCNEEDEEEDDNCSDLLSQSDRSWHVVHSNEKFRNHLSVHITSKTRCEEPCEFVPTKLYSSLKYEIRQCAKLNTHATEDLPFLLGRISMVDSQTFEEIQQDNKSNPVLKGVTESALTKKPESKSSKKNASSVASVGGVEEFNGTLKVQSSTVSYHHKKINFCWQISYFTPSDLENPILTMRSAAFKVYARKPSQNKKKKRNPQQTDTTTAMTTSSSSLSLSSFDEFANCVDELVEFSKKLKDTEKKRSIELLSTKLLQLDPVLFKECLESLHKKN